MSEAIAQQLENLKGKQWMYKNQVVEVLGYLLGCGDSGNDVEIYISGRTIETSLFELPKVLKSFEPIPQRLMIMAREEMKKNVAAITSDVVEEIRNTVLDQIRALRDKPTEERIKAAKAINESINTLTNFGRALHETNKYYDKMKSK